MSVTNHQRDLFRKNAKTFSFAAYFLGQKTVENIYVLYEFCRVIDDIADESGSPMQAKQELQTLYGDIELGHSEVPYTSDFIAFMIDQKLEKKYVLDLLEGVISDCERSIRIEDQDGLITYCYHVAGTVGALMCPLLGVKREEYKVALPAAIHLGIAMQLTNIARDIKEDAENNRIYIPQSWIALDDASILTTKPISVDANGQESCKKLLELADQYYEQAIKGYAYLPFRARLTILIAANLYKAIGIKIAKSNYHYWEGRQVISKQEKILRTIFSLTEILRSSFWQKNLKQQKPLKQDLSYAGKSI